MHHSEEDLKALQKTLENIRCVTEHAEDFYIILDRTACVRYLNDYAAACLSSTPGHMVGSPIADVFPSLAENLQIRIQKSIASGEPFSFEYQLLRNGDPNWFAFRFSPVKGDGGTVIALLCTAQDITERKERTDLIERSKHDWLRAVDGMPQLLAVVDRNYRIERVNANMADRLRLTFRKAVGMVCYKLLHGLSKPPPFCPLARSATDQWAARSIEIRDNRVGCESVSISPLRDKDGNVSGCIYLGRPAEDAGEKARTDGCLRSLMRKVDHIVRVQDPDGRYLFLMAIEGANLQHASVAGRSPFDFFEPGLASRMIESAGRVAASGRELTEATQVTWRGETFHFLDRLSPIFDASGKVMAVITISMKVAESKRAGEKTPSNKAGGGDLSPREREVLQLIAQGASGKEMARKLGISPKTVETHRARIMQKLNIHKSSELVKYAMDAGLF